MQHTIPQEHGIKQALPGQIDDPDGDDIARHCGALRQIHCAANFVEGNPDGVCLVRLEDSIAMIRDGLPLPYQPPLNSARITPKAPNSLSDWISVCSVSDRWLKSRWSAAYDSCAAMLAIGQFNSYLCATTGMTQSGVGG